MKKGSKFGERVAGFLEIPLDTVADWPRIVMDANRDVTIQNHRGVIEYDRNTVRLNTKLGEIKISGVNLALVSAVKDEIVIEGKIVRVELTDWR
jgi:sporulation protein YqfC